MSSAENPGSLSLLLVDGEPVFALSELPLLARRISDSIAQVPLAQRPAIAAALMNLAFLDVRSAACRRLAC